MLKQNHWVCSGNTILVVDDQVPTLEVTRHLLEGEGHRVLTAASGQEALALFRPGCIQLVLADYFMPQMNGAYLVREIRRRDQDVQILLTTGYAGEKPPREMLRQLDIQSYHDKADGPERLLLWVDVALKAYDRIRQIRQAEQDAARSQAQLRLLSARLLRMQEMEREQLSRDLHDHLGQHLTAVLMGMESMLVDCSNAPPRLYEQLEGSIELVQEMIQFTRELSAMMRPELLGQLGLEAALQELLRSFGRWSRLSVTFSNKSENLAVASDVAMHVYRIVQEALNNAARHAAATTVDVDIEPRDQSLWLTVSDDGQGFDPDRVSISRGIGIAGMQERARLLGGTLELQAEAGRGTVVKLQFPLRVTSLC